MVNLNLDKDSLEKALSSANVNENANNEKPKQEAQTNETQSSVTKEEEIGFHKGCLNTLVSERNELIKMIGNIEKIMQAHLGRLKELGVNIEEKNN